jgi:hypothetical protein
MNRLQACELRLARAFFHDAGRNMRELPYNGRTDHDRIRYFARSYVHYCELYQRVNAKSTNA